MLRTLKHQITFDTTDKWTVEYVPVKSQELNVSDFFNTKPTRNTFMESLSTHNLEKQIKGKQKLYWTHYTIWV